MQSNYCTSADGPSVFFAAMLCKGYHYCMLTQLFCCCRLAAQNERFSGRCASTAPPRGGKRPASARTPRERPQFAVVEDGDLVGVGGENLAAPAGYSAAESDEGAGSGTRSRAAGVPPPRRSNWRRSTVGRTFSNLARKCVSPAQQPQR